MHVTEHSPCPVDVRRCEGPLVLLSAAKGHEEGAPLHSRWWRPVCRCFPCDHVCTVHACAASGHHAQARAVAPAANMLRRALPTCSTARYSADTAATMLSASPLMPRTARYRGGNSPLSMAACSAAYSDCQPLPHCRYLIAHWHESYQPSVGLTSSQRRGRSSTHVARALDTR